MLHLRPHGALPSARRGGGGVTNLSQEELQALTHIIRAFEHRWFDGAQLSALGVEFGPGAVSRLLHRGILKESQTLRANGWPSMRVKGGSGA